MYIIQSINENQVELFDINKFKECAYANVGDNLYLKNVVKVNNSEPDPKGYIRSIKSIDILMSSNDF
jgi:hypothetical protein